MASLNRYPQKKRHGGKAHVGTEAGFAKLYVLESSNPWRPAGDIELTAWEVRDVMRDLVTWIATQSPTMRANILGDIAKAIDDVDDVRGAEREVLAAVERWQQGAASAQDIVYAAINLRKAKGSKT